MSLSSTQFVKTGPWVDYSNHFPFCEIAPLACKDDRLTQPASQRLMSNGRSQVWTNILAIYLAIFLAKACFSVYVAILKILISCVELLFASNRSRGRIISAGNQPRKLMDTVKPSLGAWQSFQNIIVDNIIERPEPNQTTIAGFDALSSDWEHFTEHLYEDPWHVTGCFTVAVLVFGYFVLFTYSAAWTAGLAIGPVGLSSSPDCDIYVLPDDYDPRLLGRTFEYNAEARARTYATTCFDRPKGADGCNLYYNQSISFHERNVTCPFRGDVCVMSEPSSVEFEAEFDSKVLGINVQRSHRIRRRSTCSPVVTDERYLRYSTTPNGQKTTEYYYGNVQPDGSSWNGIGSKYTWDSTIMFSRDTPSYTVTSFRSTSSGEYAFILPEFRVPNHNITWLLIEQGQIFYLNQRDDPIFPANTSTWREHLGRNVWYDGNTHGSVLICADTWEICTHDNETCWNCNTAPPAFQDDVSHLVDEDAAYALIRHALIASNTYNAIKQSQTYGLDAQRHINQELVTGIAEEQWRVEARLLFQSSLACLQQNVYDIQRGTAKGQPGYRGILSSEYKKKMCGIYKFRTVGYTSVNVAMTGLLIGGATLVWLLFREFDDHVISYWVCRGVAKVGMELREWVFKPTWNGVASFYHAIRSLC